MLKAWTPFCLIALFGALGALSRWGLGSLLAQWSWHGLPLGITGVNWLACLLAGALTHWLEGRHWLGQDWKPLILTGFIGAFSTYATFIAEGLLIHQSQGLLWALLYWIGQTVVGIGLFLAGFHLLR